MTTTISFGSGGVNLHIGPWNNPEKMLLEDFDTSWDAWAFAVAHGLPDPQEGVPPRFRQWCNRPPTEVEPKEQQLALFT